MKVIIDEGKSGGKKSGGGIAGLLPILFLLVLVGLLFVFIGSTQVFGGPSGNKPPKHRVTDPKGGKKAGSGKPKTNRPTHHTIQKGDTYTKIGRRYGVNYITLQRLNPSHREKRLLPGKKIRLR
ncbi:MAG: LysM domain-containing protein [Verrucomicrobiota bacterium]